MKYILKTAYAARLKQSGWGVSISGKKPISSVLKDICKVLAVTVTYLCTIIPMKLCSINHYLEKKCSGKVYFLKRYHSNN